MDDDSIGAAHWSPVDHYAAKPRATMSQYVAMNGEEVSITLEGIARVRQGGNAS